MRKSCLLWLSHAADLLRFLVLTLRSESALAACRKRLEQFGQSEWSEPQKLHSWRGRGSVS